MNFLRFRRSRSRSVEAPIKDETFFSTRDAADYLNGLLLEGGCGMTDFHPTGAVRKVVDVGGLTTNTIRQAADVILKRVAEKEHNCTLTDVRLIATPASDGSTLEEEFFCEYYTTTK